MSFHGKDGEPIRRTLQVSRATIEKLLQIKLRLIALKQNTGRRWHISWSTVIEFACDIVMQALDGEEVDLVGWAPTTRWGDPKNPNLVPRSPNLELGVPNSERKAKAPYNERAPAWAACVIQRKAKKLEALRERTEKELAKTREQLANQDSSTDRKRRARVQHRYRLRLREQQLRGQARPEEG